MATPVWTTITEHNHPNSTHPTFAEAPEQRPSITGIQSRYRAGDVIKGNCSSVHSRPAANLTWTINDIPVSERVGQEGHREARRMRVEEVAMRRGSDSQRNQNEQEPLEHVLSWQEGMQEQGLHHLWSSHFLTASSFVRSFVHSYSRPYHLSAAAAAAARPPRLDVIVMTGGGRLW